MDQFGDLYFFLFFQTLLRHPDCESARQTRDGVFRQMRSALQLIGLCVCDGVLPFDPARYFVGIGYHEEEPLDIGLQLTASVAIKQLLVSDRVLRTTAHYILLKILSKSAERFSRCIVTDSSTSFQMIQCRLEK